MTDIFLTGDWVYVWSAYSVTVLILLSNWFLASSRHKRLLHKLSQKR